MTQQEGRVRYIGTRDAVLKAWFGNDLETTALFELAVP